MPRKLVIAAVVVVGALALGVVALAVYATTAEYTECRGIFQSRQAAERAVGAAGDAGLDADLGQRASDWAVTVETGETGRDAEGDREAFREILDREGGELGHPGDGCTERTHFD